MHQESDISYSSKEKKRESTYFDSLASVSVMTAIPFLQTIEHQHHPVNRGVVGCIPYFHWREKKSSAG